MSIYIDKQNGGWGKGFVKTLEEGAAALLKLTNSTTDSC